MTSSRRAARRNLKALPRAPIHQMITFPVRQDWFALPIQTAQKVVPLTAVHSSGHAHGLGLILIDGHRVPTIDLERHIYRDVPQAVLPAVGYSAKLPLPELIDPRHVVIIKLPQLAEVLGLVVSHAPVLRRVPQSAFAPISVAFLSMSQMRCVNAVISLPQQEDPIFLLDLEQVLPPLLPPSPVNV
ncbi:chemotaxis protein CheW [Pseudanabaena sp. FACHB-2040]|uniref:chemotaxis protein CheW n=1 Tax=Pseudanabaena sp. FACHB-2040 TaxID=2692859 RepID=UPI001689009E|nr:chemotaxis protein CheW [Pseudanabaena sp. FACHB-2040]MBD0266724.1 chemotaxis protein CheW [Cyanobacteria bacterium Co-bin8]MBD2258018.1 chemotaxis protein CheW [Pseudanabaena sp. FACHB-2040]